MRKFILKSLALGCLLSATLSVGCKSTSTASADPTQTYVYSKTGTTQYTSPQQTSPHTHQQHQPPTYDPANLPKLTQQEINDLIFLREEEKLARDVYLKMYDLYKHRVFANISRSEERHTEAVKRVLQMYNIPDPVDRDVRGVFKNPELQKMYNDLVAQGSKSLVDAFKVGALIEEWDIADLEEKKKHTNNPILLRLYNNLERGSENHLRAFMMNLRRMGADYQPKYLSIEKFNEILSKNPFKGKGRGRGHQHW